MILVNFVGMVAQGTIFLAIVDLQDGCSKNQTYLLSLIKSFVVAAVALLDMQ